MFVAGCGGGGGSPTAPAPFNQTVAGTVSSFGYTQHPLSAPREGTMTLTLSWQGSADLDLYLTSSSCVDIYPEGRCPLLAVSDRASGNTEVITRTVARNETFKIWVDNFSFSPQSYSISTQIQ
jgi:hypothetical protein